MGFNIGHHHQHKRKKINYKRFYSEKIIKNYDKFIYLISIIVSIITSTQVFKIWFYKNASGVSIIAWSAYLFNSISWLIYGIIHKEKPIIFINILCIIINCLVIIGTILYSN